MQQVVKKTQQDKRKELRERIQEETLKHLYHKGEEEQATAIAKKFNLPYIDLSIVPIDAETVNSIPEEEAKKANLAVIYKAGKKFQIAVTNPESYETKKLLEKLKKEEGINYSLVVVSKESLKKAWANYGRATITETFESQAMTLKEKELTEFEKGISNLIELKKRISEIHTTEIFNIIMAGALKTNASDVHIEPNVDYIRLRYRIDGVLQDVIKLPIKVQKVIVSSRRRSTAAAAAGCPSV